MLFGCSMIFDLLLANMDVDQCDEKVPSDIFFPAAHEIARREEEKKHCMPVR